MPKPRKYKPDFVLANGIIVETKGRFTAEDRARHVLIKEQHPELDIRFVFQYDNTLSRKSDTRYSDWCAKHGIQWAIKYIPRSWAKEKRKK